MTASAAHDAPPPKRSGSGILRNVTSNWIGTALGILISFFLSPIVVRSLGNVNYGIWALLMQFTGYIWLFDFGVRESVVKYVAQHHATQEYEELSAVVSTAISLYSIVSLAALVLVMFVAAAIPYLFNIPASAVTTARITAGFAGATVALSFAYNVFVGVLMGLQRFYLLNAVNIVVGTLRAALTYVLLTRGFGLIALAVLQFVMTLLSGIVIYRLCVRHAPYLTMRPARLVRARVTRLLNYGKYVLMSNVGDKIIFTTDSIVIGIFQPIAALTYFAIASGLIENFRSFISSMATVVNPLSSSLEAQRQMGTVGVVARTGAKASILIGLPVFTGFIILGELFIDLWMGPAYGHLAGQVLAVLAAGHLLGLPYYAISGVFYGLGRHPLIARTRLVEGLVNLVLSVVLVQKLGIVGVAIGTAIPHVIMIAGVLPVLLRRIVPVDLSDYYVATYVRPLIATVPFAAACWVIAHVMKPASMIEFLALGFVSLFAYAVPCWFVALSAEERAYTRSALRRRMTARAA